jgi:hypothetical protein
MTGYPQTNGKKSEIEITGDNIVSNSVHSFSRK